MLPIVKHLLLLLPAAALCLAAGCAPPRRPVVKSFESFEAPDALAAWTLHSIKATLVPDHATAGARAVRLVYPKWQEGRSKWPAAVLDFGRGGFTERDWSRYDALQFDVYNATDREATLKLRIDDEHRTRNQRAFRVPPRTRHTCEVPIARLPGNFDASRVVHYDLYMSQPDAEYVFYVDNIRLVAHPLKLTAAAFAPDPFLGGRVGVRCETSRCARCQVQILDAAGHVTASHEATAARLAWTWDGTVGTRPAPPGRYSVVLRATDTAPGADRTIVRRLGRFEIVPEAQRPAMVVWHEPTTRKIMLHSRPGTGQAAIGWADIVGGRRGVPPVRIEMARNEYEGAQVVFLARARQVKLRFAIEELRHARSGKPFPMARSTVCQVGYVETKDPKRYKVDFIGWWPDPLLPATDLFAEPGECMPVWVSLKSEPDTAPGLYRGRLAIWADDKRAGALPIKARVHDATLPVTTTVRTAFSTYNHMIAKMHGTKELPHAMLRKYHQFIADHRINPDNIYRRDLPPIDDVEFFARRGQLNAFNILSIPRSSKALPYDDAHLKRIAAMLDPYVAELRKRKLIHLAYIYGFDEVSGDQWAAMRRAFGFLKKRYPDIPLMTTARDHSFGIDSGLDDVVDIWVPLTPAYNLERAEAARTRGRDVWWYICIGPRNPYANWFIEYTALEPRLLWWMTYQHKVPGFLYYTMTRWPLQREPMRLDGRNKTNWVPASWRTANGDGSLFCGGPDGPITTVRFENVRDGIEDHELLTLLARRLGDGGKAGRALCDELIPTLKTFTRDPVAFAAVRLRLLRHLGKLAR